MTKKRYRNPSILFISLLVLILSFLTAYSGTFEIGVVHTPTPGSATTSVEVSSATPTTTVESVVPPTAAPTSEPTPAPIYGPFVVHVAFVKDDNVWLWTEEQEAVPLTTTGGMEGVNISDDGAIVAFTRGGELWVVNRDGTGERPLVTTEEFATMERREPEFRVALHRYAWVGRTHILAFNTRLDTGYGLVLNDDLHLVNADTGELTVLFPPGQGGEFTYSPDGSQVALATPGAIFLADADGGNLREAFTYTPVSTASEFQYYPEPVWSADSSSLRVAIAPPDPYVERPQTSIWALHTDGTPARLMGSIEVARGSQPVFSAYLSQLAYVQLPEGDGPGDQGSVVLTDLTGGEMIGDSTTYYPEAHGIYGYAPDALRFAFLTNPEQPRAMLGQIGAEAVPALGDAESIAIDVRWIDADRYLLLASSSAGGWDIILGEVGGSATYIATVGGPPPAYDFAAPTTSSSTPVAGDSSDSVIPFGLVYMTKVASRGCTDEMQAPNHLHSDPLQSAPVIRSGLAP